MESVLREARTTAPRLSGWMETDTPQGLTACALSTSQRRRPRISKVPERSNEEIERRLCRGCQSSCSRPARMASSMVDAGCILSRGVSVRNAVIARSHAMACHSTRWGGRWRGLGG